MEIEAKTELRRGTSIMARHRQLIRPLWLWFYLAIPATSLIPAPAAALPPGRAWAPTVPIDVPGVLSLGSGAFLADTVGSPHLVLEVSTDNLFAQWATACWGDSSWQLLSLSGVHAANFPELSSPTPQSLFWVGFDNWTGQGFAQVSTLVGDSIATPDTIAITTGAVNEFSIARGAGRTWAALNDVSLSDLRPHLRVFYSDSGRTWHAFPSFYSNSRTLAIMGLDDGSAILLHGEGETVMFSELLTPPDERQTDIFLPRPGIHPRFRPRRDGGFWTSWVIQLHPYVYIAEYNNAQWLAPDSVMCVHPDGGTYVASWERMSADETDPPLLAWIDLGYGYTYRDVGCIAWRGKDATWHAEELPGSNTYFSPEVFLDRDGDFWAVWRDPDNYVMYFAHTHVSATSDVPTVRGNGRSRVITWNLSEGAPSSRWTVLRSRDGSDWDSLATLTADQTEAMSWTDESPPEGQHYYRVRRECVDSRYSWLSPVTRWPGSPGGVRLVASRQGVGDGTLTLKVVDAAPGFVELQLIDVQGRLVRREKVAASAGGPAGVHWTWTGDLGGLPAGVYFARAIDASGATSNAVKTVILH